MSKASRKWQLYLLGSPAMFVPYALWSFDSDRFEGDSLSNLSALVLVSLATGLLAFVIAQPTIRKLEAGEASLAQAYVAVVWPAVILLLLVIISFFFAI